MAFTLIKGTFHTVGYSPDGDSIRFQANDDGNWFRVSGNVVRNARGHAQLRFEAIDTLETHFKQKHQPLELAEGAMLFLFKELGIKNVVWNPNMTRVSSADDGTEGYILVREAERFGRAVAFVFGGSTTKADGSDVFLDTELIKESINYKSVEMGLAYPTYYKGLFFDLREALTQASSDARKAKKGVFGDDRTNAGVKITTLASITEDQVILPKLFRRLVNFERDISDDLKNIKDFIDYLKAHRDPIMVIDTIHFTNFHNIIEVKGKKVRLRELPENIVFL